MAYEYTVDDVPEIPLPLYTGWGLFADLFGQQNMRGPLRLPSGDVWAPVVTFAGDNRTGIFSPEPFTIGYAIYGFLRFLVSDAGVKFLNTAGFGGTVAADVITADRTYQLPDRSGTLALEVGDVSLTNANAGSLVIGTPVYISAANSVDKARANSLSTSGVFGLAVDTILTSALGTIRTAGLLTATTGEWDAVTGETGGLTVGATYYLDPSTAGKLTQTPANAPTTHRVQVGIAVASTKLVIRINPVAVKREFESFSFAIANSEVVTLTDFLAGRRGWLDLLDSEDEWSEWRFNATSVTAHDGSAEHVTGTTPGATEIAVSASGDDLLIEAGSGAARTIGMIVRAVVM